jgi:hypothetical protein
MKIGRDILIWRPSVSSVNFGNDMPIHRRTPGDLASCSYGKAGRAIMYGSIAYLLSGRCACESVSARSSVSMTRAMAAMRRLVLRLSYARQPM